MPPRYEHLNLDCGFRLDLLIDERMIAEIKAVEPLAAIHECQLLTYPKMSRLRLGLSLSFNVSHLRHGIRRIVL